MDSQYAFTIEELEADLPDVLERPEPANGNRQSKEISVNIAKARSICAQIEAAGVSALGILPKSCKKLIRTGLDLGQDGRSEALFRLISVCLKANIPPEVIMGVLLARKLEKSGVPPERSLFQHIADQPMAAEKYLERQIRRVAEKVDLCAGGFKRNEVGKVITCVENTEHALVLLAIVIKFNLFTGENELCRQGKPERISDESFHELKNQIDREFEYRLSSEALAGHLTGLGKQNEYDPVLDRFDLLPDWDGISRVNRLLPDYFGAEDTAFNQVLGEVLVTAMVRRQYKPGDKFDLMPTFTGKQGVLKSTCLYELCLEPSWFVDGFQLNGKAKDILEITSGKMLAEADELGGLTVGACSTIKSNLTRKSDRARLAYGRYATERQRRFVNVGTTNDKQYLRDSTGNRRFPGVAVVRKGSPEKIKADREQIWAEA